MVVVGAGLACAFCGLLELLDWRYRGLGRWGILVLWLGLTGVGAVVALISEMTAFQRAQVTHLLPVILVVQIAVAVGLAPLVLGET